jgi:hypothetical protein
MIVYALLIVAFVSMTNNGPAAPVSIVSGHFKTAAECQKAATEVENENIVASYHPKAFDAKNVQLICVPTFQQH